MTMSTGKAPTSIESARIEIYTDGGCEPNPGPGGYPNLQDPSRLSVRTDATSLKLEIILDANPKAAAARQPWAEVNGSVGANRGGAVK